MPANLKPPAERKGRSAPKAVAAVPAGALAGYQPPEAGWLPGTAERWDAFWTTPLAGHVAASDLSALRRLFTTYDEVDRMTLAIEETGRVVEGSQGQPRPNPLIKARSELAAEARQLEDRFGLTPLARMRLGISFGQAANSLAAMANAAASGAEPSTAEIIEVDPRVVNE